MAASKQAMLETRRKYKKDSEDHRLKEQFRSLANPPPGTIDDSDESSNTSEHGRQNNSEEADE